MDDKSDAEHTRIIYDLFGAIENIIKGISSVSKNVSDNFIEYKIQTLEKEPVVLLSYEKSKVENDSVKLEENSEETSSSSKEPLSTGFVCETSKISKNKHLNHLTDFDFRLSNASAETLECPKTLNSKEVFNKENIKAHDNVIAAVNNFEMENISEQNIVHNIISIKREAVEMPTSDNFVADGVSYKINEYTAHNNVDGFSEKYHDPSNQVAPTSENGFSPFPNFMNNNGLFPLPGTTQLHSCSYCSKSFTLPIDKERHERSHIMGNSYYCRYCNKRFTKNYLRLEHEKNHLRDKMSSVHSNAGKNNNQHLFEKTPSYNCDYCNKQFKAYAHKKRHEVMHTGERPFKCDLCGKRFTAYAHKKRHEVLHTGERPYQCDYCKKTFTRPDHKKKHERTHFGGKYNCNFCDQAFDTLPEKLRHEFVHDKEMQANEYSREMFNAAHLQ